MSGVQGLSSSFFWAEALFTSAVFEEISSESEGGKLFKTVSKGLVKLGRWYLLPYFILQCGAKFIGFRLGKRYPKLKPGFVKKCSSNRAYWERFYGQNQSHAE